MLVPTYIATEKNRCFAAWLLGTVVAGLIGLSAILGSGGGAYRTESNYFSSLVRLQEASRGSAPLTLIGSSITGRLPGRESQHPGVANLGADGGSMIDGLRLLRDGKLPAGPVIFLETNTLQAALEQPVSRLVAATTSPWFRAGSMTPVLGYAARPTSLVYGSLLGGRPPISSEAFMIPDGLADAPVAEATFSKSEEQRLEEIVSAISVLQRSGHRVIMVEYPAGPTRSEFLGKQPAAIFRISSRTGAPFLDLSVLLPRDQLRFTDPVHLAPDSAARVVATLERLAAGSAR